MGIKPMPPRFDVPNEVGSLAKHDFMVQGHATIVVTISMIFIIPSLNIIPDIVSKGKMLCTLIAVENDVLSNIYIS